MSRLLVAGALLASLSVFATPASATTDGGEQPRLLAYAGPEERWAIVALESVQEPCGWGHCTIVAVDLGAKTYRERWPYEVPRDMPGDLQPTPEALAKAYVATLPAPLSPLTALTAQAAKPLAEPQLDGQRLTLRELETTDAMAPYDDASQEPCFEETKPCSSCQLKETSANGRPASFWRCTTATGRFEGTATPCMCHAPGRIVALSAKGFLSRRIHLEPWAMGQNMMNGPGVEPTTEVELQELMLHRNARGDTLLLGGAVHARMANGTWFPVVAYRPSRVETQPPDPEPEAQPQDGDVTVVVPPEPPAGGCAGCATSPARRTGQGAWLLLLLAGLGRKAKRPRR